MKEGSCGGASLCKGFHYGDLEGGFCYWGTRKMRLLRDTQMPCKWASLFIGDLFEESGGGSLAGTFER
jgi:hypothetical protein